MITADTITDEQRASIVQNGLTRKECEMFFALFRAAVTWRHVMVRSNRSGAIDEHTEETDRAQWAACGNHNAKLIAAVDAWRDHLGIILNARAVSKDGAK